MKEFKYTFVQSNGIIFEVNYYTLGSNKTPHFTTCAAEFNRTRTDFNRAGQSQEDLLRGAALAFYHKWDKLHLKDLTPEQHSAILDDIELLKVRYPYYLVNSVHSTNRFSDEKDIEYRYRNQLGREYVEIKL